MLLHVVSVLLGRYVPTSTYMVMIDESGEAASGITLSDITYL